MAKKGATMVTLGKNLRRSIVQKLPCWHFLVYIFEVLHEKQKLGQQIFTQIFEPFFSENFKFSSEKRYLVILSSFLNLKCNISEQREI